MRNKKTQGELRSKRRYSGAKKTFRIGELIFHKTVSMVLIVLIVLIFVAYSKEIIRAHNINSEIRAMEIEIGRLETNNNSIFHNIQYYKTLSWLEREGRLKVGQGKDGEKVMIINNSDEYYEQIEEEPAVSVVYYDEFNPMNWMNYFFGKKK